jgi:hypothetical protein
MQFSGACASLPRRVGASLAYATHGGKDDSGDVGATLATEVVPESPKRRAELSPNALYAVKEQV